METSRIIEIVRFKKGGDIQSPSIEEAQELARMYLVAGKLAHVMVFKEPDPSCKVCGGSGLVKTETGGDICDCSKLADPIYIIPDAPASSTAPLPDQQPENVEPAKDGD